MIHVADPTFALLAVVVFGAFAVQAVSGFGSIVLSLTFGAHLYAIPELLPVLVPLVLFQCLHLGVRHHGGIDWRIVATRVFPLMGAGMVLGMLIFEYAHGAALRTGFAALVLVLAVWETTSLVGLRRSSRSAIAPALFALVLVAAGVIHGVYATGGPLLVYALARLDYDKRSFRSTLLVIWFVLDIVLTAGYARAGRLDVDALTAIAVLLPVLFLGNAVGEYVHHRVDERRFRIAVFALLGVAAVSLLLRQ